MIVTPLGNEKNAEWIFENLKNGEIVIDGDVIEEEFYKTEIKDNVFKVYFLLDDDYDGEIEAVRIYDVDDDLWAEKEDDIDKPEERLLLVSFRFEVIAEEVEE